MKEGISSVFDAEGRVFPVTVLKIQAGKITAVKSKKKEGYSSVQVGFVTSGGSTCKEFSISDETKFSVGSFWDHSVLDWSSFSSVDVTGVSKGRGFQGVMKRFGASGGPASHGCSKFHRRPGSIGMRSYPGRVFKGKMGPGRMGGEKCTISNLKVFSMNMERGVLLVKGSVPGCNGSLVCVRGSSRG